MSLPEVWSGFVCQAAQESKDYGTGNSPFGDREELMLEATCPLPPGIRKTDPLGLAHHPQCSTAGSAGHVSLPGQGPVWE